MRGRSDRGSQLKHLAFLRGWRIARDRMLSAWQTLFIAISVSACFAVTQRKERGNARRMRLVNLHRPCRMRWDRLKLLVTASNRHNASSPSNVLACTEQDQSTFAVKLAEDLHKPDQSSFVPSSRLVYDRLRFCQNLRQSAEQLAHVGGRVDDAMNSKKLRRPHRRRRSATQREPRLAVRPEFV